MSEAEIKINEETGVVERYNLTLENVPVSLHRAWKAMAAMKGISMKEAALLALRKWVHDEAAGLQGQLPIN